MKFTTLIAFALCFTLISAVDYTTIDPSTGLADPQIKSVVDFGFQYIVLRISNQETAQFSLYTLTSLERRTLTKGLEYKFTLKSSNGIDTRVTASLVVQALNTGTKKVVSSSYSLEQFSSTYEGFDLISAQDLSNDAQLQAIFGNGLQQVIADGITDDTIPDGSYLPNGDPVAYRSTTNTNNYIFEIEIENENGFVAFVAFELAHDPNSGDNEIISTTFEINEASSSSTVQISGCN